MKLNLRRLESIRRTLEAVDDIDLALSWYLQDKCGPGYVRVREPSYDNFIDLQLDREELVELLEGKKQKLIESLEQRYDGFEYDPDADR